jgi:biopolymer transport protein ExbB/TolQ
MVFKVIGKGLGGAALATGVGLIASGIAAAVARRRKRKNMEQLKKLIALQQAKLREIGGIKTKEYRPIKRL